MVEVTKTRAPYQWQTILDLLHICFAYMDDRIAPRSSLHRLTVQDIEAFAGDETLLTVEDQSCPVACAFLTRRTDHFYIGKLAVLPGFREKGFAKRLINDAAKRAAAKGFRYLELETRIELTENHAAFTRLGFVKTAETSHSGFDRPTSITMRRQL